MWWAPIFKRYHPLSLEVTLATIRAMSMGIIRKDHNDEFYGYFFLQRTCVIQSCLLLLSIVHFGIPVYEEERKPLSLVTFEFMFSLAAIGLSVAFVAFCCEMLKKKQKMK